MCVVSLAVCTWFGDVAPFLDCSITFDYIVIADSSETSLLVADGYFLGTPIMRGWSVGAMDYYFVDIAHNLGD